MPNNPWGEEPRTGYEQSSDEDLEHENMTTLCKEQGDVIEFVTAQEVKATIDDMLIGTAYREQSFIMADTPIGQLQIYSPSLGQDWFTEGNISNDIEIMFRVSNVFINDPSRLDKVNKQLTFGKFTVERNGAIVFTTTLDFSRGLTDIDLRVIVRDVVDQARTLFKRLQLQNSNSDQLNHPA